MRDQHLGNAPAVESKAALQWVARQIRRPEARAGIQRADVVGLALGRLDAGTLIELGVAALTVNRRAKGPAFIAECRNIS